MRAVEQVPALHAAISQSKEEHGLARRAPHRRRELLGCRASREEGVRRAEAPQVPHPALTFEIMIKQEIHLQDLHKFCKQCASAHAAEKNVCILIESADVGTAICTQGSAPVPRCEQHVREVGAARQARDRSRVRPGDRLCEVWIVYTIWRHKVGQHKLPVEAADAEVAR